MACIVWYVILVSMRCSNVIKNVILCSCLDDSELDYLGASWAEYSRVANDLGLDVLRFVSGNILLIFIASCSLRILPLHIIIYLTHTSHDCIFRFVR